MPVFLQLNDGSIISPGGAPKVISQKGDVNANAMVSQGTAISKLIDSIATYPGGSTPTFLSASALLVTGAGQAAGIFVSIATTTPTIKLWNNTAASGTVLVETFTPVAGTYYQLPNAIFTTGCYATISGTVSATFFTSPTTI